MSIQIQDLSSPTALLHADAKEKAIAGRLRIMHVVNYLRRGGTEFGILKLMAGLGDEQFEHRFCSTRQYDDDFVRHYHLRDILDVVGSSRRGLQFPLFRLRNVFRQYRPHIVHTRNWGALEAVPAARLAGVPVVIHSEHGYEVEMLGGLPLRQRLFRRIAYTMTDAVFAVTHELRDYHARQAWVKAERIQVIYNGVDTDHFAPCAEAGARVRSELGLARETFVIGSVGRMVPIKNYGTLLQAADQLLGRGMDLHVLLVGSGPEMASLQQQASAAARLRGRVWFLGACDRVTEVLNAMDVFVLPSLGEGMSNTLLEAMGCGLPLVATRVGGNPEVVGERDAGCLFQPGDVAGLAKTLHYLATNPEIRRRLRLAARDRAVRQFSLKQMLEQYRNLYLEAARRRCILGPPQ